VKLSAASRCSVKSFIIELVLLGCCTAADARGISKAACIQVDDENTPLVTLSGRVAQNLKVPKNSELRAAEGFYAAKGFYIKLDTPLRASVLDECADWGEIAIFDAENERTRLGTFIDRYVVISGKLGRFGSALVYPAIFVRILTIKKMNVPKNAEGL
jgi:hypothetical protein